MITFTVQGAKLKDIKERAFAIAQDFVDGSFMLKIAHCSPVLRNANGSISLWEADIEIHLDD